MKQRDILLVPFPFSDQSGYKVRPVLVLSNERFNSTGEDMIVCGITSNVKPSKYSVVIGPGELEEGVLYDKSAIKVENIVKLHKSLIIKKIGKVKEKTFSRVYATLLTIFSNNT